MPFHNMPTQREMVFQCSQSFVTSGRNTVHHLYFYYYCYYFLLYPQNEETLIGCIFLSMRITYALEDPCLLLFGEMDERNRESFAIACFPCVLRNAPVSWLGDGVIWVCEVGLGRWSSPYPVRKLKQLERCHRTHMKICLEIKKKPLCLALY